MVQVGPAGTKSGSGNRNHPSRVNGLTRHTTVLVVVTDVDVGPRGANGPETRVKKTPVPPSRSPLSSKVVGPSHTLTVAPYGEGPVPVRDGTAEGEVGLRGFPTVPRLTECTLHYGGPVGVEEG